jgi:hypothetical protein
MHLRIPQLNILKRLEKGPRTLRSFSHQDENAHLAVHFERYLNELQSAGFVVEIQENWHITHSGLAALREKVARKAYERIATGTATGTYDGAELRNNSVRPGAYQFLQYPSRFGDNFVYR